AISKAITLRGAGNGQTVITNNYTGGSLITVTESATGNLRIEGFSFRAGAGPGGPPSFFIDVFPAANGKPVLITGNSFQLDGLNNSANALGFKTNRGVVWNNTAIATPAGGVCLNNAGFIRHKAPGLAQSWRTGAVYGNADTNGDQNLYVENNIITN